MRRHGCAWCARAAWKATCQDCNEPDSVKPFIPFLLGACALFWGWQTGNYAIGAVLALALEAPRYTAWRLDLTEADYRRIPDFCSVLFAGVAVLFFVNRGAALGVLSAVQWFPVVVAPLSAAQRFGRIG